MKWLSLVLSFILFLTIPCPVRAEEKEPVFHVGDYYTIYFPEHFRVSYRDPQSNIYKLQGDVYALVHKIKYEVLREETQQAKSCLVVQGTEVIKSVLRDAGQEKDYGTITRIFTSWIDKYSGMVLRSEMSAIYTGYSRPFYGSGLVDNMRAKLGLGEKQQFLLFAQKTETTFNETSGEMHSTVSYTGEVINQVDLIPALLKKEATTPRTITETKTFPLEKYKLYPLRVMEELKIGQPYHGAKVDGLKEVNVLAGNFNCYIISRKKGDNAYFDQDTGLLIRKDSGGKIWCELSDYHLGRAKPKPIKKAKIYAESVVPIQHKFLTPAEERRKDITLTGTICLKNRDSASGSCWIETCLRPKGIIKKFIHPYSVPELAGITVAGGEESRCENIPVYILKKETEPGSYLLTATSWADADKKKFYNRQYSNPLVISPPITIKSAETGKDSYFFGEKISGSYQLSTEDYDHYMELVFTIAGKTLHRLKSTYSPWRDEYLPEKGDFSFIIPAETAQFFPQDSNETELQLILRSGPGNENIMDEKNISLTLKKNQPPKPSGSLPQAVCANKNFTVEATYHDDQDWYPNTISLQLGQNEYKLNKTGTIYRTDIQISTPGNYETTLTASDKFDVQGSASPGKLRVRGKVKDLSEITGNREIWAAKITVPVGEENTYYVSYDRGKFDFYNACGIKLSQPDGKIILTGKLLCYLSLQKESDGKTLYGSQVLLGVLEMSKELLEVANLRKKVIDMRSEVAAFLVLYSAGGFFAKAATYCGLGQLAGAASWVVKKIINRLLVAAFSLALDKGGSETNKAKEHFQKAAETTGELDSLITTFNANHHYLTARTIAAKVKESAVNIKDGLEWLKKAKTVPVSFDFSRYFCPITAGGSAWIEVNIPAGTYTFSAKITPQNRAITYYFDDNSYLYDGGEVEARGGAMASFNVSPSAKKEKWTDSGKIKQYEFDLRDKNYAPSSEAKTYRFDYKHNLSSFTYPEYIKLEIIDMQTSVNSFVEFLQKVFDCIIVQFENMGKIEKD